MRPPSVLKSEALHPSLDSFALRNCSKMAQAPSLGVSCASESTSVERRRRGWAWKDRGAPHKYTYGIFETGSLANPVCHSILPHSVPLRSVKISTHSKKKRKSRIRRQKKPDARSHFSMHNHAGIEDICRVEEQNLRIGEIHKATDGRRTHIAQVNQCDLCIAFTKKRCKRGRK